MFLILLVLLSFFYEDYINTDNSFFQFVAIAQNLDSVRIMSYNCENFFDTYDQLGKNDKAFLPSSMRHWTYKRYKHKIANFARVVAAVGEGDLPVIISLVEIENSTVLIDITKHSVLSQFNYSFIHKESRDIRGIDVALLYQRNKFKLLNYKFYHLIYNSKIADTRDILYAKGILLGIDTLHIFVNHWSSRLGGKRKSEYKRIIAATTLKSKTDSIFKVDSSANIIIMGDFNDTPQDVSVRKFLCSDSLFNLANGLFDKKIGTYKYKYSWDLLDQIIVSKSLLCSKNDIYIGAKKMTVFREYFILQKDKKYFGFKPYKTYNGMRYLGGFSDHLPVYISLYIR